MISVQFFKKQYRQKTRRIMIDFIQNGSAPREIAKKFGISTKTAERCCWKAPSVAHPGEAPEFCRLGKFASFKAIIEPIITRNGVTWAQVVGPARTRRIALCRWECWASLHDAGKPYLRIADFFSRDHATVIHGVRQFRAGEIPYKTAKAA